MTDAIQKVDEAELEAHAKEIIEATKSEATKEAYRRDMLRFATWAEQSGYCHDPASERTVAAYVIYLSKTGKKPSTINRALSAINQYHALKGLPKPAGHRVKEIYKGIRRLRGGQVRQARPITWAVLDRMLKEVPGNLMGIRDRALLLLGFATAYRRSELVAINVKHITFVDEGLIIEQTRSKTNQEGLLVKTPVPFAEIKDRCPVRAVRKLMFSFGMRQGPLFRGLGAQGKMLTGSLAEKRMVGQTVSRIIKKYAALAGYDPEFFSGHSLRSGFVTSASEAGLPSHAIMMHTGHKSHQVMMGYVREGRLFTNHPFNSIINRALEKNRNLQTQTTEEPLSSQRNSLSPAAPAAVPEEEDLPE